MDIFGLREQLVEDYRAFSGSFVEPRDPRIGALLAGRPAGLRAIVVYPMNALANSQLEELRKFLVFGYPPVSFERYTGQEPPDERLRILAHPPDVLLTN